VACDVWLVPRGTTGSGSLNPCLPARLEISVVALVMIESEQRDGLLSFDNPVHEKLESDGRPEHVTERAPRVSLLSFAGFRLLERLQGVDLESRMKSDVPVDQLHDRGRSLPRVIEDPDLGGVGQRAGGEDDARLAGVAHGAH